MEFLNAPPCDYYPFHGKAGGCHPKLLDIAFVKDAKTLQRGDADQLLPSNQLLPGHVCQQDDIAEMASEFLRFTQPSNMMQTEYAIRQLTGG